MSRGRRSHQHSEAGAHTTAHMDCLGAGILQARENRRVCEAAGGSTDRWQFGLSRSRERPDDLLGYIGSLLCTTGSERKEQEPVCCQWHRSCLGPQRILP
ncbi:Ctr9, Paf1/RNA polymerase II complex component, homolog (S. cerevisiae), isoform CRA_d [Mus musculus]|nr:Ctr9, Paf1/RNA polymerase II complex component, homolog (S. cerevisiae), isoform CRA_d [Mus musculus]